MHLFFVSQTSGYWDNLGVVVLTSTDFLVSVRKPAPA